MSTHRRTKNVDYDEDEIDENFSGSDYSSEDEEEDSSDDDDGSGDEEGVKLPSRPSRAQRARDLQAERLRRRPKGSTVPKSEPKAPTFFGDKLKAENRCLELPTDGSSAKASVNLVVVGQVDAGKSTLVGHLLLKVGAISAKQINKYKTESAAAGKSSFAYAWVMDEGTDERERGVTIDVCVRYFETPRKLFTVLDAPGHGDFVPNLILGALQAESALLVVDAADFDTAFERGRVKEHCRLVRALGIQHLVVAVNKMDTVEWSQECFVRAKAVLHAFLTAASPFAFANVAYIPISAFQGVNLEAVPRDDATPMHWAERSLVDALDSLPVKPLTADLINAPARALVVEAVPGRQVTTVALKVVAGGFRVNETLLALPAGETVTLKRLEIRGHIVQQTLLGDYVENALIEAPLNALSTGSVLVAVGPRPPVGKQLRVRLIVIDPLLPLCQGQTLACHLHGALVAATVLAIECALNKRTGEPLKTKPRALKPDDVAVVLLRLAKKVAYEENGGPLGRVVLRDRGRTAAAGIIVPQPQQQ